MSANSKIEWTQATWNPLTGCTKVSPGCKFCYAERLSLRLQAMGRAAYRHGFELSLHEDALGRPLLWKKRRMIFVNSMSDLFQEEVPLEFITRVFAIMGQAHWHTFQLLTKRADRLLEFGSELEWRQNIWMGVSVENEDYLSRMEHLRRTPANIKFLSLEPLLGPLTKLDLDGINWVIVGGESGPSARPMDPKWVVEIQKQCKRQGVPFFFKQWGGRNKKRAGRILDGRTWDEMPAH